MENSGNHRCHAIRFVLHVIGMSHSFAFRLKLYTYELRFGWKVCSRNYSRNGRREMQSHSFAKRVIGISVARSGRKINIHIESLLEPTENTIRT